MGEGEPVAAAVKVPVPPAVTFWDSGWVVMTGAPAATIWSTAAVLVTVPELLVNTARYSMPEAHVAVTPLLNELDVAPPMGVQLAPALRETCHWTVGAGEPVAAAVKVADWGAVTVWASGWVVTTGTGVATIWSTATVLDTVPELLVNTARYSMPEAHVAVTPVLNELDVAPPMVVQLAPALRETCHWTVGAGEPVAAAVKVADWGAVTVWASGWVVTTGTAATATTVINAGLLATTPEALVNCARPPSPRRPWSGPPWCRWRRSLRDCAS